MRAKSPRVGPRYLDIGEVAAATGVAASALRFYERCGLLTPAGRSGLRRIYHADVIDRVALILSGQATGFSLRELADLLRARPSAVRARLVAKTREIDEQIARQVEARSRIGHALTCRHPSLLDCPTFRGALRELLPSLAPTAGAAREDGARSALRPPPRRRRTLAGG